MIDTDLTLFWTIKPPLHDYIRLFLQGLKGDGSVPAPDLTIVQPHVAYIVQFITVVAQDSEHSGEIGLQASTVLGSWYRVYTLNKRLFFEHP